MKQTLNNISSLLLGVLFCAMGLLLLSALLSSCSPKLQIETPTSLPWMNEKPKPQPQDTITWIPFQKLDGSIVKINLDSLINGKVVIDSIVIAGEMFEYHDSIPCPEGLKKDSTVRVVFTKTLPDRTVPLSVTVMDTVWLIKPCPPTISSEGSGWGERIAWMSGLAALLFGYWKMWRNKPVKTTT